MRCLSHEWDGQDTISPNLVPVNDFSKNSFLNAKKKKKNLAKYIIFNSSDFFKMKIKKIISEKPHLDG